MLSGRIVLHHTSMCSRFLRIQIYTHSRTHSPAGRGRQVNGPVGEAGPHDGLQDRVGDPHEGGGHDIAEGAVEPVVALLHEDGQPLNGDGHLGNACGARGRPVRAAIEQEVVQMHMRQHTSPNQEMKASADLLA